MASNIQDKCPKRRLSYKHWSAKLPCLQVPNGGVSAE